MVLSVLSSALLDLQSSSLVGCFLFVKQVLVGCFLFVKQVLNRPFDNNQKKTSNVSEIWTM